MPHKDNDTIETTLRVTALEILIKSEQKNVQKNFNYNDADLDFDDLVSIGKTFVKQNKTLDKMLQHKLYDSVKTTLDFYPNDQKIDNDDYNILCSLNENLRDLIQPNKDKFKQKVLAFSRQSQTHQSVMH